MLLRTYTLAALALLLGCAGLDAQSFADYEIVLSSLGTGVNSAGNDYAPTITPDRQTLYFTSYARSGASGEADEFYTRRVSDRWSDPLPAGPSLNSAGNEGGLAIANDGHTVVFAAERTDGIGNVDLYIADLHDGQITNVRNMGPSVNSKGWDSHPTISGDGSTVYFASNREGGSGRTDIWMTRRNGAGDWSAATNMGPVINTSKDERSPYVTPDGGTLYFSSKGHDGRGGYDVFMTYRTDSGWAAPLNLGNTINSPADELFFQAPLEGDLFYMSSSRDGGIGKLDIYSGTPNIFGAGMARLNVSVIDSTTGKPLPGVISIVDVTTGRTIKAVTTSALVDHYQIPLPAGRRYRVEARVRDTTKSVMVTQTAANTEQNVKIPFGRIVVKLVDFGKYDIPFFVTGYYRPNTAENLEQLFTLRDGELHNANYIEDFSRGSKKHEEYQAYSKTVESLFNTLVRTCVDDIYPEFRKRGLPSEVLEIRVTGFADPQPIQGDYVEGKPIAYESAEGMQQTIRKGDRMDNVKLSGLRAYYSAQQLDTMMSAASASNGDDYNILKKEGRIVFRYISGGVSADKDDFAAKRRILVEIDRREREPGE
ncbi:MAG TPA: hypothetical protein VHI13_20595 [Candidatus Kapabacteria bacterium]|nr:hypothetical protein [Candidatus Kapabacteria bacterium]